MLTMARVRFVILSWNSKILLSLVGRVKISTVRIKTIFDTRRAHPDQPFTFT